MNKRYDNLGLPILKKKQPPTKKIAHRPIPVASKKKVPAKQKAQGKPQRSLEEGKISRIESNFHLLPQDKQEQALDVVQKYTETGDGDEIELDLDKLPYPAQIELYTILDGHFKFDTLGEQLPDICESPEREDTSKKIAGPA